VPVVVTNTYGHYAVRSRGIISPIPIRGGAAVRLSIDHHSNRGSLYWVPILIGYEDAGVNCHKMAAPRDRNVSLVVVRVNLEA